MRRGVLTLIASAWAGASGCSLVFPIDGNDDVPIADDKDGDTVPDGEDNCVGIANPEQENVGEINNGLPADLVGDACDPNPLDDDDEVLLTFLFDEPDADRQQWNASGSWQWVKGYAEVDGDGELIGMPLGVSPEKLVIEASFEMVDTPDMYAGLSLDPSCRGWIHVIVGTMRDLGITELFANTMDSSPVAQPLRPRFVLQLTRRPQATTELTYVKVWLRETEPIEDKSIPDTLAIRGDGYGVWSQGGRMRVHHVVVYAGR